MVSAPHAGTVQRTSRIGTQPILGWCGSLESSESWVLNALLPMTGTDVLFRYEIGSASLIPPTGKPVRRGAPHKAWKEWRCGIQFCPSAACVAEMMSRLVARLWLRSLLQRKSESVKTQTCLVPLIADQQNPKSAGRKQQFQIGRTSGCAIM